MSAFDNVSIGVDKRECFGILGPNGSGKTSLLNTVSFSFPQTLGKIYYDGKDTTERRGNEISLGYCPQEDTLWDEYSLTEHIEMFLYICGHSLKEAKKIAKKFISYCHLTEHKNKMPSELSGGTRRKLNLLIALCCSSSKIIMDEPTAGMDPSTRRYVWDIIRSTLQVNDSSNMICTHSMEEAELLCNRIAIMIKGKIRCIGSPEHLKMKFGNSYILDVYTDNIKKFHEEVVVGRNLFNDNHFDREVKSVQRIKYEVQSKNNISRIFDIMEDCRKDGLFIDYNYSQTSLEQIFLNFANKYNENE
ncbi:P-loop containing nucleoside triphosphate hydrolase protein [Neocallimastix californiae]|uniref:p-loop containing nucleoside triphosphate hydrolase protein n=1 Tax=Neocallimastix californiae TaxID=1754190 RepID=A0A1Y1YT74_9FUNG|nr:P-loop containing nucleoside triphosphate hydrolase protein [Neocallimastix californiae]|eukprot:ORY00947.1 P-loop containing nucleoside triphosphate hydrolase protein [Neocallimastix californiae]